MGGAFSRFCCIDLWHLWSPTTNATDGFDHEGDESAEDSSLPSSSSSPPPPVREDGFQYDVFLSFSGPDTRNGFTSHLYYALKDKGILTFMDSEKLEKGQKVDELFGYIERSKIFLPIFSKGFAESKWCLKEIGKIVECKRLVMSVFLDVEPRDVRHQTGFFGKAFRKYLKKENINKEEVSKWRDAMTTLGKVSGYTLADTQGNEAKLIQLIVKKVVMEVYRSSIYVADYPIGLDARIIDVMEMLDIEAAGDAKMVGIYGMGGIGKTTLAKAVYNKISNRFDASCFIPNIREVAEQLNGLVSLQKQLLRDLFGQEEGVSSIDCGIGIIKERIQFKKVLLVLDDVDEKLVDNKSQLQAMAGDVRCFCSGSRIIVTTRNKHVFNKQERVNLYKPNGLNDVQSLELFSWHAFGKRQPTKHFAQLSREAASTAMGLPLALKISGAHFYDLKTVKEWVDTLKILKDEQHKDIYQRLKISFDALLDKEKQVFLDIACFFIGKNRKIVEHATLVWEDCKFYPNITIKVLMHKSLLSINDRTGEFEMHDQIRDMGRKIIEDEGLYKDSRLWEVEKTLDILQNKKEMENVEAIQLYAYYPKKIIVDLAVMPRLRMLRLEGNVTLEGDYKHFPKKLKWLEWRIEDLNSLPDGLQFGNIVVIDLSFSSITQVWNPETYGRDKVLEKLKVLSLSRCYNLTSCPDFTSMPHLEKLDFSYCRKLSELHPSIGLLNSLTCLDLCKCASLMQLPDGIYQLTSLKVLDLSYCSKITSLPSQLEDSRSLKQHLLSNLEVLSECRSLTSCPDFTSMPHLQKLDFSSCGRLSELHPSIELLKSLTHLYLSRCESLEQLPEEIYQLTSLKVLDLSYCSKITSLPSQLEDSRSLKQLLLGNLEVLNLSECESLTSCPNFTSMPHLQKLDFSSCGRLSELHPSIGLLKSLTHLNLKFCFSLKQLPEEIYQLTSLKKELENWSLKRMCRSYTSLLLSSSSSPPVIREDSFEYDVFLSFRGPDTGNGFTSHLYHALKDNKGILTFMDSEELEKGQKVDELFWYIERSKIFLPILSKGFAESKWCLKEITKMLECNGRAIPVFFDVEPSDVRRQTGPFEKAFTDYVEKDDINKEELSKWRDAMRILGQISGYNLAHTQGNEAKLIQLIVETVLMEVNRTSMYVADYPVGLDARIIEVMGMLDIKAAGNAKMVGIYGMGGLGKTTLAKAVYNKISNRFDASCFIPNIRDTAERFDGLVSLQKQLLRDLFGLEVDRVSSIDQGICIVKNWMQRKKVLIVLDDVDDKLVDNKSQLQAMAGDVKWFCSGSRIIVTTRDKQVFKKVKSVNVYELKGLNDVQSLELFNWYALGKSQPTEDFAQLSRDVASTAAGLPLALKIFGSHFCNLKTVKEWVDTLKILKDDQHKDIYQRLKI